MNCCRGSPLEYHLCHPIPIFWFSSKKSLFENIIMNIINIFVIPKPCIFHFKSKQVTLLNVRHCLLIRQIYLSCLNVANILVYNTAVIRLSFVFDVYLVLLAWCIITCRFSFPFHETLWEPVDMTQVLVTPVRHQADVLMQTSLLCHFGKWSRGSRSFFILLLCLPNN